MGCAHEYCAMVDFEKLYDEAREGMGGIYKGFNLPGRPLNNLEKKQST